MDQMVSTVQKWLNTTYGGNPNYTSVKVDGITGGSTVSALIKALQIEIGVSSPDGVFGKGTLSVCPTISPQYGSKNEIYIVQGALYCKGYNPNGFDGVYGNGVITAIERFQADAGLTNQNGQASPIILQALLNTDAYILISNGDSKMRTIQQNLNRDYNSVIGLIPTNGVYSKSTNVALIKALQREEGLSTDGIWGTNTMNACPTIPGNKSTTKFVLLLQYALYCNGFDPSGFDGLYGNGIKTAISNFQTFVGLTSDGYAGPSTWASLLVSYGDKNRKGTACDCSTTITSEKAKTLKSNGYNVVGRYLTGKYAMTAGELEIIFGNNLSVIPIFEVGGYKLSYFNSFQGLADGQSAVLAAKSLGLPQNTIIYFAVDFDALDGDVTNSILPYFSAIKDKFSELMSVYKIGIYAPRNICSRVAAAGYSCSSFICDMSSGFSGNLGYKLPTDWAFDQISTIALGNGEGSIEIDNNISSGKYNGFNNINHILIYQSARKERVDQNGKPADDLATNDFTKDKLLSINSLFENQLDEASNPDTLFSEFENMCTTIFAMGEMKSVILDMINHFKSGTGTNYSNDILTEHARTHHSTTDFVDCIKTGLINQLIKNKGDLNSLKYNENTKDTNPLYQYINTHASRPVYKDIPNDVFGGLTITVDDTWGNNVYVKDYSFDGSNFTGTLHFNIYDHFGLDLPDVQVDLSRFKVYGDLAGFRAWFVLQHYTGFNGKYVPFVTNIEFDVSFEGILN